MNTMSHKSPTNVIVTAVAALLIISALTPKLIALSDALVPLVLVVGVLAVVVRLVFFHTRRW
jgi:hypothetical protein